METSVSITGVSAAKTFRVYAFLLVSLFARPSFAEEDPASVIAALGLRESVVAARDQDDMIERACQIAFKEGFAKAGERDIVVAGVPLGTPGATNMIRIAFAGSLAAGEA